MDDSNQLNTITKPVKLPDPKEWNELGSKASADLQAVESVLNDWNALYENVQQESRREKEVLKSSQVRVVGFEGCISFTIWQIIGAVDNNGLQSSFAGDSTGDSFLYSNETFSTNPDTSSGLGLYSMDVMILSIVFYHF